MSLASNTRLIVCHALFFFFFPETWECYDCHLWILCNVGGRQNNVSGFLATYELGRQTLKLDVNKGVI